jgi:hypothetical protein
MGRCIRHPDRETPYLCQKHNIYLCEECMKCRDPDIYCKFRPACPIHYLEKENARAGRQGPKTKNPATEEKDDHIS